MEDTAYSSNEKFPRWHFNSWYLFCKNKDTHFCKRSTTAAKNKKSHNDLHTRRVEDLHTPLSPMDRSSRKTWRDNIGQNRCYKSNVPNMLPEHFTQTTTTKKRYCLLSSSWNFIQIDHLLRSKASLHRYKQTEITVCILSWIKVE